MLLHELSNTLASLRLRIGLLAADPTCRWAQEENVAALQKIVQEATAQAKKLRAIINGAAPPSPQPPELRRLTKPRSHP